MSLRHRFALRSIASTAAIGLAASAVVLGSATTASAAPVSLNCDVPVLGAKTFVSDYATNAPASVPAGTPIAPTLTLTMAIPEDMSEQLRGLGTTAIEGSVVSTTLVNGKAVNTTITIPRTTVTPSGAIPLNGAGKMPTFVPAPAGVAQKLTVGAQTVNMKLINSTLLPEASLTCNPAAPTVIDTIAVTAPKAASLSVKAKYTKKKKSAKVTATTSGTGKVTMTLLKGKKKVKAITASIVGGKAVATFKKLKKGKYTVKASYAGSPTAGPATASTKFKAK